MSTGLTISTACFVSKDAISSLSKVAFSGSDGTAISITWRVSAGWLKKGMGYPRDIVSQTQGS